MAEEEGAGGVDQNQTNGNDTAPQVGIISQYVKDLSFENPNSPAVYQWQGQPAMDVEFNIGAQKLSDEVHEVVLKINITAKAEDNVVEIYSKMKPDAAAERLASVDPILAAGILMKLDPRQAGVILNEMKTKPAAELTGVMAAVANTRDPS